MSMTIRAVEPKDHASWAALYAGYRAFYRLPEDPASVAQTWQWVHAGEHELLGLVAVDGDDRPVALANLRWFARPSTATIGLYLDDLFTSPDARGTGAGSALLEEAKARARDGGASIVRWITATDNATARSLYESHAQATSWVTYDMKPSA